MGPRSLGPKFVDENRYPGLRLSSYNINNFNSYEKLYLDKIKG